MKRLIAIILLPLLSGMSQTPSIETIYNNQKASLDSSRLLFVTHPSDSSHINMATSRFGAWVRDTSAKVTVQGREMTVWPSGAVADMIELEPGWNTIPFFVESNQGVEETLIHVFRKPPREVLPAIPTKILDSLMVPESHQTFYGENSIFVSFTGSPGGTASFSVKGLTPKPLPMKETFAGHYVGELRIHEIDQVKNKRVEYRLKGEKGWRKKRASTGTITVVPDYQPHLVKTNEDHTLIHFGMNGEIFMDLPKDIELKVKADFGEWLYVEAAPGHSGYVRKNSIQNADDGELMDKAAIYSISSEEDSQWVYIQFNITGKVPFDITNHLDPSRVSLTLFRTYFQDEWTTYPVNQEVLDYLDWVQLDDSTIRFDFVLSHEQSWGYYGTYKQGKFVLAIRKPPVLDRENPLNGLTIAIDAGHGGDHKGAVGATGLMEKDANLVYSYYLKELLEKEGAAIVMTRPDDRTMGLAERMDIAVAENAQLFMWMHNNSTGLQRHPDSIMGTSVYYKPVQSMAFARSIYPHLKDLGLDAEGFVHRSYYMTRQTYMPVILVEGAFLSNPQDEMFLMKDENLKQLAQAVAAGLKERLMSIQSVKDNRD